MGVKLAGLGSYLPQCIVKREDLVGKYAHRYDHMDEEFWDVPSERRHCNADETAVYIAVQAAKKALAEAKLKSDDLDFLMCFSAMEDYIYPKDG